MDSWKGIYIEQEIEPTALAMWDDTLYETKEVHELQSLVEDSLAMIEKRKRV